MGEKPAQSALKNGDGISIPLVDEHLLAALYVFEIKVASSHSSLHEVLLAISGILISIRFETCYCSFKIISFFV